MSGLSAVLPRILTVVCVALSTLAWAQSSYAQAEPNRNDEGQADAPSGTFITVSAGEKHTCALNTQNQVECWGLNDQGQGTPPR